MTKRLYYTENSLTASAAVLSVSNGEMKSIVLSQTIFHPQGGGQKADIGSIGPVRVVHVSTREDGEVVHRVDSLDGLTPGMEVPLQVDAASRRLHARLHTAGHLLAAVGNCLLPSLRPKAGHHWPGEARVEFEITGQEPDESFAARLQAETMRTIALGLPVKASSPETPPRTVRIGDYLPIPCGGTHVSDLRDLDGLTIRKIKCSKGVLRISYDVAAKPFVEYDPARY
jgi:alanyl-tRNA synthetase